MKPSQYNNIFKCPKGNYVFNSLSDRFVEISDEIYQCLEKNDIGRIQGKALEVLMRNKCIIPDETDEYQQLETEYEDNKEGNIYDMTLLPTLDCNVNCWYCFEKQHEGSRLHKVISDSIVAHIKWILPKRPNIDKFIIALFGGEPMLHFKEDVFPLLKEMQQIINEAGKIFQVIIVTNGICMTEDNILLLRGMKVNFQISIDGYKKKHDTVKRIKGQPNISAYDCVMKNIVKAVELLGSHINLRINYDNNTLHHLTEVLNSIKNIPRNKITIHFERVWQTADKRNSDNVELKSIFETFLRNGFSINYLNLSRRKHSCRASRINQLAISYDGAIYKCTGRDFSPELKEGVLRTDGSIKWDYEKLNRRLNIKTYDIPQCRICKFLPLCWGACCQKHLESLDKHNDIEQKCQIRTMEIPIQDYLYYRLQSKLNRNL